jgi:endonuclease/exonuclease/phosphatase family metal-dependent hydrolase
MTEVRLATFNVENLFARFKFEQGIDPKQAVKDGWTAEETVFRTASPEAKKITGQAIKATQADILCLQEVENLDALKRFRNEFVGGSKAYEFALSIDGNDPRFIDVAVLSKYPIVHARSYAHLRQGNTALFSRDCLEVDVLIGSETLTLFVQHYKSMMGGRKKTRARRAVQVRKTKQIIRDRFGAKP